MSAWTVIAHTEVGSGGASSIDFQSIAATYTDLIVFYSLRPTTTNIEAIELLLNNSTSNFTTRWLEGNGASVISGSTLPLYIGAFQGTTADTFSNGYLYIPNYASSNNKSFSSDNVSEANQTTAYQTIRAGLWSDSSVINRLTIRLNGQTLAQYSSATLYGITKGSSGGVTVS